ncbi:hypothetical protein [Acidisphaera sp. S103]|uniref:hypothetical protein n=1 Tax=Acidisphaera sp. S103 TaxID=1747223 RepID=UPI00131D6294|nr:hypothetical protein [Acidisphaera sp. S103]
MVKHDIRSDSGPQRYEALDSLRGIAAAAVVAGHSALAAKLPSPPDHYDRDHNLAAEIMYRIVEVPSIRIGRWLTASPSNARRSIAFAASINQAAR